MTMIRGMRNALNLLLKGDWREFLVRIRIFLGQIDLRHDPTEEVTERTHYYADSGGVEFDKIMANFHITPNDAIVDFGCGKGGVLISLSKYPFSKITGVELSSELVAIARENISRLKISNVNIQRCDATEFTELTAYNYFYFFDPFPCVVMAEVLKNIENSLQECPRTATIIYLNPYCHELLAASKVFAKTGELPHYAHRCFVYSNTKAKG